LTPNISHTDFHCTQNKQRNKTNLTDLLNPMTISNEQLTRNYFIK